MEGDIYKLRGKLKAVEAILDTLLKPSTFGTLCVSLFNLHPKLTTTSLMALVQVRINIATGGRKDRQSSEDALLHGRDSHLVS